MTIQYEVTLAHPGEHRLDVRLSLPPSSTEQTLKMAKWIPGSYKIRDFAKHILSLRAESDSGSAIDLRRGRDHHEWVVPASEGVVHVYYEVYAHDFSVRGCHFDSEHAFLNGTGLFWDVLGKDDAIEVVFHAPHFATWSLATAMPVVSADAQGFGRYSATDYEALIDYPVEIGTFSVETFTVKGIPHRLVVSGKHHGNLQTLTQDVQRVCETQHAFFDSAPIELDQYLFLLQLAPGAYGGLEHRNSTALVEDPNHLPSAARANRPKGYANLLTLFSHEYFHTWWVKRVRPEVFTPHPLDRLQITPQLWVFEGFTSYYEDIMALRAGVIRQEEYWQTLSDSIGRFRRAPGHQRQSAAASSEDAWIRLYQPDENTPNATISYYTKGKLIALCLDLWLLEATKGEHRLDDVLQQCWQQWTQDQKGLKDDSVFECLAQWLTPSDIEEVRRWVEEPGDLPLEKWLGTVGLAIETLPADIGGEAVNTPDEHAYLGGTWNASGDVRMVRDGTPLREAGVAEGDRIVAIAERQFPAGGGTSLLQQLPRQTPLPIHVFRRGELLALEIVLTDLPQQHYRVHPQSESHSYERQLNYWLHAQ